MLACAWG